MHRLSFPLRLAYQLPSLYRIRLPQQARYWSNKENKDFYDQLYKRELELPGQPGSIGDFIKRSGMDSGCDLKLIKRYFPDNLVGKKAFEGGAGAGRATKELVNYGLTITAVEQSPYACEILKKAFGNKITLINASIQDVALPEERYHLIFLLWCVLPDFSKQEQLLLLHKLTKALGTGGHMFIDLPHADHTNATSQAEDGQEIRLDNNIVYRGYVPTDSEMSEYLAGTDCTVEKVPYTTDTNRIRNMYVFFKPAEVIVPSAQLKFPAGPQCNHG